MDTGVLKPVADDDVRVVVAPEEEAGELEMEVDAGAKAKPTAKGKAKARRGRKTVRFEKCSWVEVSARPQALTLVTRFGDRLSCGFDHKFCWARVCDVLL